MYIDEKLEVFDCLIETEAKGSVQVQRMQAPRLFIEQTYAGLVEYAAYSQEPARVKMSREVPVWCQCDQQWVNRKVTVEFKNNAYLERHGGI